MRIKTIIDLSDREVAFVRAIADGCAPTVAASAAGYSIGHAKYLMTSPRIVAALVAIHENTGVALDVLEPAEQGAA